MAGNGLSVAHAWLQMHKTHVLLGDQSPFVPRGTPTEQVESFQNDAIKLSEWAPKINGHFWELAVVPKEPDQKKPRKGNMSVDCPPTIAATVPS